MLLQKKGKEPFRFDCRFGDIVFRITALPAQNFGRCLSPIIQQTRLCNFVGCCVVGKARNKGLNQPQPVFDPFARSAPAAFAAAAGSVRHRERKKKMCQVAQVAHNCQANCRK
jgi:hypothetical protein